MEHSVIALVDCNNFFVSCERLFRPDLENKPVVVLSSNDGCVISRSNEAKALGIPMGAPAFKHSAFFKQQGVIQFSANFELYGDISQRVTRYLAAAAEMIEVYSVDESFLDLYRLKVNDYRLWANQLKDNLLKDIGIPVAIGIASSKTLAKLATDKAKKDTPDNTILDLANVSKKSLSNYLLNTPVNDIWGVGRRLAPALKAIGLHTALDLAKLSPRQAGQLMGVHGRQLVAELNGCNCYPIIANRKTRQSIMHGRMFGEDTNILEVVEAAIMSLTAQATAQLRQEGLLASSATIILRTNRHKPNYKRISKTIGLNLPSASPGLIGSSLIREISRSLGPNLWLHQANVILGDLTLKDRIQLELLNDTQAQFRQSQSILRAFDIINERFGKGTVHLAAEDLSNNWRPKKKLMSPCYTTNWRDLPVIT